MRRHEHLMPVSFFFFFCSGSALLLATAFIHFVCFHFSIYVYGIACVPKLNRDPSPIFIPIRIRIRIRLPVGSRSACRAQLLSFVLISIIIIIVELSPAVASSHSAQLLLLLLSFYATSLKSAAIYSFAIPCESLRQICQLFCPPASVLGLLMSPGVAAKGDRDMEQGAVTLLLNWAVPKQWTCVRHATTSADCWMPFSPCRHILYAYMR